MPAYVGLWCVAGLLGIAAAGIVAGRRSWGSNLVYGASLLASLTGLVAALWHLLMGPGPEVLSFALGLPGVGANFRLDALASFFLVIVNFGGAAASLYAHRLWPARSLAAAGAAVLPGLSRGHESGRAGGRCLFIPGRLGIHVAVVLGAGDGEPSRAGKRPRGLRLSRHGELRHPGAAAGVRAAGRARRRLRIRVDARASSGFGHGRLGAAACACRSGLESGPRAAPRLAAAGASGGAEPCLGADERSDDQGRHLRLHPHRVRSGRRAGVVDQPDRAGIGGRDRGDRHSLGADAERSEASFGLFHRRECRDHLYRPWAGAGVPRQSTWSCRRRSR